MNQVVKIERLEESLTKDFLARFPNAAKLSSLFIDSPFQTMMIDGQWGEGKTWFARAMHDYLQGIERPHYKNSEKRANVIWLDAFAHESMDDPLLVIWQHIINELSIINKAKIKQIVKSLLAIGVNAAVEFVPQAAMVKKGLNKAKEITDGFLMQKETLLEEKLSAIKEAKEGREALKKILEEKAKDMPLFIFIDELDRCNPHFAVRLFERVKHYLDAKNVKIIYVANKEILSGSIAGYYNTKGTEFKAKDYLEKFIDRDYHVGSFQILDLPQKNNFIGNVVIEILGKNHSKKDFFHISLVHMFFYHSLGLRKIKSIIKDIIFNDDVANSYNVLSMWFYIAKNADNTAYLYTYLLDIYNKSNIDNFYTNFTNKMNETYRLRDGETAKIYKELNSFFDEFYKVMIELASRNLIWGSGIYNLMANPFIKFFDNMEEKHISEAQPIITEIFRAIQKVEQVI